MPVVSGIQAIAFMPAFDGVHVIAEVYAVPGVLTVGDLGVACVHIVLAFLLCCC
jgi:hypothetical protein